MGCQNIGLFGKGLILQEKKKKKGGGGGVSGTIIIKIFVAFSLKAKIWSLVKDKQKVKSCWKKRGKKTNGA